MDRPFTLSEGVDSWNTIIFLYRSALKEVSTKVEILNDEFQQVHQYNPIEYIKSRIKSPESIVKKLKRYGYESSIDNMEIQIRTMAMDFWASLEHKIYYKFEGNAPQYISRDLRECSEIVSMLDAKMLQLNEAIIEARAAQEEDTDAV